ncbi:hypothetical protein Tco_1287503, partial [Tanacetum coccineum]
MPSWASSESRVISGRVEYFCKCSRQLTVQTAKTRKNPGKRFVTCSKCKVYDFLDDDLPSEYYKELLYGMFQNKKQSKKHMDYEQVINVLAMKKSMCEEELRATKSKLKLYDSLKGCLVMSFIKYFNLKMIACKCKMQMLACKCKLQIQDANASSANACLQAASCKCLPANASYKCKLQMLACKFMLQMQAANACLQMQAANVCLQMQAANA